MYKDLNQPLVLKELQKLTFDLMKVLPLDFNTEFAYSIVLLYLLSTNQDLVVFQVPKLGRKLQQKLTSEFFESCRALRNIKKVVTSEERQLKFVKIRVLSSMLGQYPLSVSTDEVMTFSLNLRSMITFESPRFLI